MKQTPADSLQQPAGWQRPPFWRLESLIATWFGAGLLPKAPGTWGSLAALPFAVLLVWLGGPWALLAAAAALFVIGTWASAKYAGARADPGEVVVDEVVAQWLVIFPVALDLKLYLLAFVAFRVADILKPWPANWADRRIKGGLGIMLDDILAAPYAMIVCYAAWVWLGRHSCFPWTY
ncbi:phosphatidylglycerophosphatase A family protein [Algihabitans albus]|uniref:phosphatidylglycerophosphatase A family protein n=1 Tax=Algihabitans albus TaxID=2164067 RepID=UPI001F1B8C38|nr:phosphatidylglycerophosphatase A [Algihabitans albus]